MDYFIIPDKDALDKCAWCHGHISDVREVFGAGGKFKTGVDLSIYEGHCLQLDLDAEKKQVYMMVTAADSEARKEGHDGMFLLCCAQCGQELKETLTRAESVADLFETIELW